MSWFAPHQPWMDPAPVERDEQAEDLNEKTRPLLQQEDGSNHRRLGEKEY